MSKKSCKKAPFHIDQGNIFNDILFTWMFALINYFRVNEVTEESIYNLPDRLDYRNDLKKVRKIWKKISKEDNPKIWYALWGAFKYQMIQALLPVSLSPNVNIINSLMIAHIVRYIDGETDEVAQYIVIYSCLMLINTFSCNYSYHKTFILIGKIKSILTEMILEKTLKTSYSKAETGKFTSVMSSDLELLDFGLYIPLLGSIPTFVIGAGVLLWYNLGIAGIIGLIVVVIHLPIIILLGKIYGKYKYIASSIVDSRMKMVINFIEGIRIVKLHGWEEPFIENIYRKRREEIDRLKMNSLVTCINKSLNYGTIGLVLFVTFSIHVTLGNKIDPSSAFSSIAVLVYSTMIVVDLGSIGITGFFTFVSAMNRITSTLCLDEKKSIKPLNSSKGKYSIRIQSASFNWINEEKNNKNTNIVKKEKENNNSKSIHELSGINFKLKPGELLIVIGKVGSGKTTLFMGLLQEIKTILKDSKDFFVNGSISYASQEPWIISDTIKENIIMGNKENLEFYQQVINCCSLNKDLDDFKDHGDETKIGDMGITLSGGQKARISLARAIYSDKDIFLLDDPLSAVDPEVCFHIFNNCIKGLLKNKTVILATHQQQFLSQADKILILDEGKQIFFGSYQNLLDSGLSYNLNTMIERNEDQKSNIPKQVIENKASHAEDKSTIETEKTASGRVPFLIYLKFWILGYKNYVFMSI